MIARGIVRGCKIIYKIVRKIVSETYKIICKTETITYKIKFKIGLEISPGDNYENRAITIVKLDN